MTCISSARVALIAACTALLLACGGGGAASQQALSGSGDLATSGPVTVESAVMPESQPGLLRQSALANARPAQPTPLSRSVVLEPLPGQQAELIKQNRVDRALGAVIPRQIGVARGIAATRAEQAATQLLRWYPAPDGGQVAAISFTSPAARQVRLGILVRALPSRAVVRTFAQSGGAAHAQTGQELAAMLARNRDAGDMSDAGRTYWAPAVEGDEVTLEIQLPAGVDASAVRIAIAQLSHVFEASSSAGDATTEALGDSQICQLDVSCASGSYDEESNAVARLSYVNGGNTFSCTGTLLNTTDGSFIPYLLTANHCFATQTEATSLSISFFFRSVSCNSFQSRTTSRVTGGATLLYTSTQTDTTFVRMANSAPAGARFAAWSTSPPVQAAVVLGVHHPMADLQRYSLGNFFGHRNCAASGGGFSCTNATAQTGSFLEVDWAVGLTESGSSGSGLWATQDGRRYLVGQLYGGNSRCTAFQGGYSYTGLSTYGRFDLAYANALNRWLSPAGVTTARSPIFRFYNATTGAHFYTQNSAERDFVIAANAAFRYEGIAFHAYAEPVVGATVPVYRFYNRASGSHFYTAYESEKAWVQSNPQFNYEGVSWHAQLNGGGPAVPIHRFYNAGRNTHFFTISDAEKQLVQSNDPSFRYEQVVYYAWATP